MRKLMPFAAAVVLLSACSLGEPASSLPRPTVTLEQSDELLPVSETAEVVERVKPAIVNVRTTANDPSLGESRAEGSGVVIDRDGIILTNAHVVRQAVEVQVVFNDGHEPMEGQVLGAVPERDIAVVQVDADDLTEVEVGRSSALRLGDEVLALGFPLGLEGGPSVTKGIVSALNRSISVESDLRLEGLLQTDAAINPGNSGGALVDSAGRLVGINTAAAPAASAENIGFAIAIDEALPVIEEIINQPREEQGFLGVSTVALEPAAALQLGLDSELRGALVVGVFPSSPAEAAGVEEGDVIVRVGDREVETNGDLTEAITALAPGDEIEITLVGPDGDRTVTAELAMRQPTDF